MTEKMDMSGAEKKPINIELNENVVDFEDIFTHDPESGRFLRGQKIQTIKQEMGDDQGFTRFFVVVDGADKGKYYGHYNKRGDLHGHIFDTTKEEIEKDLAE